MKWLRTLILFDRGDVLSSADWKSLHESYVRSIVSIDFPEGTGSLTLKRRAKGAGGQWQRNGVNYLKSRFINHITEEEGWQAEGLVDLASDRNQPQIQLYPTRELYHEPVTSDFGGFDFVSKGEEGHRIAIEWETGNISSSHRSMNKLALALANGALEIGVLIVPSRSLYQHLTDRIGNIGELSGYLPMWESLKYTVNRGLLAITVVEHDALTDEVAFPYLPLGNDGRAKQGRDKQGATKISP